MIKKLLTVLVLGLVLNVSAQNDNHIKEYAAFLVEIEQSIDKKAMDKNWKKRQDDWRQEVLTVESPEKLNTLAEEFKSNFSSKVVSPSALPSLKFTGDYEAYGKDLSRFAGALPREASNLDVASYKTTVLAVGQEFKQKEMAARAKQLKMQVKPDFTKVFKQVFEDSKQGSFAKIADDKKGDGYTVNVKMNLAESAEITIDEEKIYTYTTDVKLTDDLAAAKEILKDMQAIIKANVPSEYGVGEWIDEEYVDRTVYDYEFKNEIFSVTAKKPSIAIGLIKKGDVYYIRWSVTEPVFKDWARTNRDWNARDGR